MCGYYDERLSADSLRRVYEIARPRIRRYLDSEIAHVLSFVKPNDLVLELGCGYGRVLERLAAATGLVVGIDTSRASLDLAGDTVSGIGNCRLAAMDAGALGFVDDSFDLVVCIQNGISAFHADQRLLIDESVRVARRGGLVLFSSYADRFWDERLRWFEQQAEAGLLGEIDYERTGDGVIMCTDGFTATTVNASRFRSLTAGLDAGIVIEEIDGSSVFCRIIPA